MKKRRLGMAALALLAGGLGQMTPTSLNAKTIDYGRSPKEYGQWLQSKGLQKWCK